MPATEQAQIQLFRLKTDISLQLDAPWFRDPLPTEPPGWLDGLWEFEVVELFVAGANGYLELEFGPGGHHLGLFFREIRVRSHRLQLPSFEPACAADRWTAQVRIPGPWLPAPPWRANAFSVSGPPETRRHRVAHLLPGAQPDFHQPQAYPPLF